MSWCGYAQLAPQCFEDPGFALQPAASDADPNDWLKLQGDNGLFTEWVIQPHADVITPSYEGLPGTHAAYMDKENVATGLTAVDYLITPEFNLPPGAQLKFQSRLTTAGDNLTTYKVMILPQAELANADDVLAYDPIPDADWTELEINPSQLVYNEITVTFPAEYENTTVRVAFVMEGDNGDRWLIDCVSVTELCLPPANLVAGEIGLDTAVLTWDNPAGATTWEIEIVPGGGTPTGYGVIYEDTDTTPDYTATGTASGNPLVQTPFVSNTEYKYWVRAICDDGGLSEWVGALFFETVGLGDTCNAPIEVTTLPYSTTDDTTNYADEYNGSPGGCGTTTWDQYLNGNDVVYEFTPDFTGTISIDLIDNGSYSGIWVYEECADIGNNCFEGGAGGFEGNPVSLEFAVTEGEDYFIVISTYAMPQTTPYTMIIQQVFCDKPENLSATNIGMTTAELLWDNPSGATSWEVEVGPAGEAIPSGAGEYTVTTNTGWDVPAGVLGASTAYQYYVRADCGDGTFSAWAGPFYFNTAICETTEQCAYTFNMWAQWNGTWNGHTMNVVQNGIVVAVLEGPPTWGMGTVTQTVNLCTGYDFELFWNANTNWAGDVAVSITNNFDQTIYTKNPGESSPGSSLFTVEEIDCETPMCLPPTGLTASNPTLTTIDLAWDGPATGEWEYYIVEAGGAAPTVDTDGTVTTTNPTIGAGPVEPATEYEYYVRMICDGASTPESVWAGPFAFSSSVCDPALKCDYTFVMHSNWGSGYAGGYMTVSQNDVTIAVLGPQFTTGSEMTVTIPVCTDEPLEIFWDNGGDWSGQMGLDVTNNFGQTFFTLPFESTNVGEFIYEGEVDCDAPMCLAPAGLTATNATLTTIDLGWDGPSTGEWEYYIVEAGDPAPTDDTEGETTTTNPVTVDGLEPATEYEYYVRMICEDAATDFSPWAGPFAFSSSVCDPAIKCDYTFEMLSSWWSGWTGGYMTVSQGGVTVAVIGPEFETGETMEVTVGLCHDLPFEVTWDNGGDWAGQMGLNIYNGFDQPIFSLPYNNDGTQLGEMIFESVVNCETPLCLAPTGLYTENATTSTIDLGWDGPATGEWEYYIVEAGEPAPTDDTAGTSTTTNPTVGAPVPDPSTNYEFYVRLVCEDAASDFSPWAGPFAFHSEVCDPDEKCTFYFEMTSENGWNYGNNTMTIFQGGVPVATIGTGFTWEAEDQFVYTEEVQLCPDVAIEVFWNTGGWDTADKGLTIYTPFMEDQYVMEPGTETPGNTIYVGTPSCDPPSCPKPQNLTVANIDMESVQVGWTEMGDATQWEIFLVPAGADGPLADSVGVMADSNPFTLTEGVEPGTDYEYYVRAVCAEDDKSLWTGPLAFQSSLCPLEDKCAYTFTMSSNYMWDDGWVGDTMDVIQGGIVVATLTGPLLENGNEDVELTLMLCSGAPISVVWNSQNPWNATSIGLTITHNYTEEVVFDMPIGEGASYVNTTLYTGMPYCAPITCPWPTDLTSAGFDLTSVILNWTPGGAETEWEVIVQPIGGPFPQPDAAITATTSEPTYHAEGLVEGVFYEYYVRAICGDGDVSFWSGPRQFSIFMPDGCSIEVSDPNNPDLGSIINGQAYVICPGEEVCVDLTATYLKTGSTEAYTVEEIDYAPPYPFIGGTPLNVETDDIWSPVVELPFNFCFYGETYNECIVGSNGVISFDTGGAGGYCPWPFSGEIPQPGFPILNAIYGPYQDIFPVPDQGEIYYQVLGSYPCRALVVSYYEVPQFSCGYNAAEGGETSQIVLYEVTNTIEVYVQNRIPCDGWQGGVGVIGIQNADGTEAVVPAGYNTGNWEAHEVAFRFTPSGDSNVVFEWLQDTDPANTADPLVLLSNEDTIEFCAEEPSILIARATYTNCDGEEYEKESMIQVYEAEPIVADEAQDITVCGTGPETMVNLDQAVEGIVENQENYNFAYYLTEADAIAGGVNPMLPVEYAAAEGTTTIWVRIERNEEPCYVLQSFNVTVNVALPADELEDVTACDSFVLPELTGGSYFTEASGGGIELSAGEAITSNQTIYVYSESGTTPNCTSETSFVVTIIPTPEFSLGGPYIACEPETLVVAVTPGNFNEGDATYAWSFGGAPVGNTSSIVPTEFGAYTVTVTVGDCSTEQSVTVTENTAEVAVMVDDYCEDGVYMLEAMPVEFEGVDSFNPDTATYEWTGTNFMGDTRVVTVPTEGVYTVTVTTADGCVGEATYEVSSIACTIQRGISPNGDEYNQYFDLETLDVAQLSIFNRYGQEVYTKSNYTNEWHGQANNGDELPTGTYFYMIERSNGEQITGWIYVNREE